MGASASVIQEYYKAVDYWADIEVRKDWKLAIWVVEATDVDLIDRFFEIERSPVGQFDDIFSALTRYMRAMIKNSQSNFGKNMSAGLQKKLTKSMMFSRH